MGEVSVDLQFGVGIVRCCPGFCLFCSGFYGSLHCVACYGCFVLLAGFGFLLGALQPWFVWWV